jgi:hypothetical protein
MGRHRIINRFGKKKLLDEACAAAATTGESSRKRLREEDLEGSDSDVGEAITSITVNLSTLLK